jgi:hypothetical protein
MLYYYNVVAEIQVDLTGRVPPRWCGDPDSRCRAARRFYDLPFNAP